MESTLNLLKYTKRLNQNLMPAPEDKKFREQAIYVRPPKEQVEAKTFQLRAPEGQFDLEATFNDKTESALHVLARVKKPKKPAGKGAPPAPAPAAPRGEFTGDVVAVLTEVFGPSDALQVSKFKDETKGTIEGAPKNQFKRLIFSAGKKEVAVYIYKQDIYDVALIFVYDVGIRQTISSKVDLCLGSFSVGQRATNKYNGGSVVEEPADDQGGATVF
ncbi:hypothetical protein TA3x_004666 [Tundrisphaera sp. TA3]|uniref:hypothetical protein n=1 Tax=Tundrisphaera sp. TA3 TaxID=3435775 RepID=UPI003EC148F2